MKAHSMGRVKKKPCSFLNSTFTKDNQAQSVLSRTLPEASGTGTERPQPVLNALPASDR